MLDIRWIRKNTDLLKKALEERGYNFDLEAFLKIDEEKRLLQQRLENLYAEQNKFDAQIKKIAQDPSAQNSPLLKEAKQLKGEILALEARYAELSSLLQKQLYRIPNIPHPSLPRGDASFNRIVKEWGELKKIDFKPLTHIELGEHLNILDFKRASKICGANFSLFKGDGSLLERALINFMLDLHTCKHGYKEVFPPFLVNRNSMTTTAQLPNLEVEMYRLKDDDYFLIPTAEVPVTNIHADEIINEEDLPLCYVAYSACFRREAGSYGKETKGLIRVHQFDKVELVKFTKPEDSYLELEKLLQDACEVIELLEIPYRVVLLSTQDLSFAAAKCYDIEIYAPGLKRWLEVSSCSNFEDFQARRGNIRLRRKNPKNPKIKTEYVHTLNGSGVALARLIIAVLENYQQRDGTILIPQVLRKYMHQKEYIKKNDRENQTD